MLDSSCLSIGMATYNDFDGIYFTIQALKIYHNITNTEIIIIDNYGCEKTKSFVINWVPNGKYFLEKDHTGTSVPRNLVFERSTKDYVLCLDCHVLLVPGAVRKLLEYYSDNPETSDLIQGPLYYDDIKQCITNMNPIWREQMFGTWEYNEKIKERKPFEIPMHGLGLFSCRKDKWLGFNPNFSGFGGEEGYIHEKFRKNGAKTICLPELGWVHRFGRPDRVQYPLDIKDRIRNYIIGHIELKQPLEDIYLHFKNFVSEELIRNIENSVRQNVVFT